MLFCYILPFSVKTRCSVPTTDVAAVAKVDILHGVLHLKVVFVVCLMSCVPMLTVLFKLALRDK